MLIDSANFTPYASLIGGLLIGLAASILILINGQVAGVSGILRRALIPSTLDGASSQGRVWRIAFILGLILSPIIWRLIFGKLDVEIDTQYWQLIAGGLLVGFGTAYGSGCTSGHGVCGLARLSLRSLVATVLFMASGILTVYLLRHVLTF